MKHLLKIPEAAILMNISEKTMWKMVYGRKLDVVRIGRSVRIPEASIEKIIDDATLPADDDDDA